jgi:hypothetical protein
MISVPMPVSCAARKTSTSPEINAAGATRGSESSRHSRVVLRNAADQLVGFGADPAKHTTPAMDAG